MSSFRLICPHCGCNADIPASKQQSVLVRVTYARCTNYQCGHTFVTHTEAVRTLNPPRVANPLINLPLSQTSA